MGFTPPALLNRPQLPDHLGLPYRVFSRLSRSRQWTDEHPQAISIKEFNSYCGETLGLPTGPFREDLLDMVQDMDKVFLDHIQEKKKQDRAKAAESDVAPK